jgi:hypothetical protein
MISSIAQNDRQIVSYPACSHQFSGPRCRGRSIPYHSFTRIADFTTGRRSPLRI